MALDWLRRLIGPPAQEPDIHVRISPGTVVRPGDMVILCLPGQPLSAKVRIAEAAKQYLPTGATLMVFCDDDGAALVVSKAVKEFLRANGRDSASDTGPHEFQSLNPAPDAADKASEQGRVDELLTVGVLGDAQGPQASNPSHREVSP